MVIEQKMIFLADLDFRSHKGASSRMKIYFHSSLSDMKMIQGRMPFKNKVIHRIALCPTLSLKAELDRTEVVKKTIVLN